MTPQPTPICCATCVWSATESTLGHRKAIEPDEVTVLACRRRAPAWQGFPWVAEDNWCGDYFVRQAAQDDPGRDNTAADMSDCG